MVSDGDAHILFAGIEARLQATVARQDVMLFQHVDHNLAGSIRGQHLAEEVVGL